MKHDDDIPRLDEKPEAVELQLYKARIKKARREGLKYFSIPIIVASTIIFIVTNSRKYNISTDYLILIVFILMINFGLFLFIGISKTQAFLDKNRLYID